MKKKSSKFPVAGKDLLKVALFIVFAGSAVFIVWCGYLTLKIQSFTKTMTSFKVGITNEREFNNKMKKFRAFQGICEPQERTQTCYTYGFQSYWLVRVRILPDTILIGGATFDKGIVARKTELFKADSVKVSTSEGEPDPYANFNGRAYIANSVGSASGLRVQINPEAPADIRYALNTFNLKCFWWKKSCETAYQALPAINPTNVDID